MKRFLLLALVFSVMATAAPALADGEFYVIAGGGGVGTKISSLPYTIDKPGFYYLGGNLTLDSGSGITVNIDNVTIDLMGFCLSGNILSNGVGILMEDRKNVEIRNGTLRGWGMEVISTGFKGGANHRVINIRAEASKYGIFLAGSGHLVKGCTLSGISYNSIFLVDGGSIIGNVINGGGGYGIGCGKSGSVIGNNVIRGSEQTGIHLSESTDDPILMDQNTVSGGSPSGGSRYAGGSSATVWAGKSTDNPWGSNAGHQ